MTSLAGFNAEDHEPEGDFEIVAPGKYRAAIVETEMRETKKKTGHYLQLTFQLLDEGEYKGRKLWARLNVDNPNETAVRIAKGQLSSICRAVGVMKPQDSSELHDIPLIITVKTEKREDNDEWTNVVSGFKGIEGEGNAAPAADEQTAAAGAKEEKPPWLK